jgi:hypothetical protein
MSDPAAKGYWTEGRITVLLFLSGIPFLAAGLYVGISDNPPGISLVMISLLSTVLAFAHRLRTPERMLVLAGISLAGFLLCALLHNLFDGLAQLAGGIPVAGSILTFMSVGFFLVATLACPAGILVGVVGGLLASVLATDSGLKRALLLFGATAAVGVLLVWACLGGSSWYHVEKDDSAGRNGSFEVARSGYPANWHVSSRPIREGTIRMSLDSTDAADGRQSLRIDVLRPFSPQGLGPGLYQTVPARAGERYKISCQLRGRGTAFIRIHCPREGVRDSAAFGERIVLAGDWKRVERDYAVPEGGSEFHIAFEMRGPGSLWLDDVRIDRMRGQ